MINRSKRHWQALRPERMLTVRQLPRDACAMTPEYADAGAIVMAYLAAGDQAAWGEMERCLTKGVVAHSPGGSVSIGIEAVTASWAAAREGLKNLRHEVHSLLVSGDAAAARITVTGLHQGRFLGVEPTGARIVVDQALFVRMESRQIAEMWEVVDTGAGLQQLGVLGEQALSPGT